jgi:ABC-2 type transport system ATP-binding protein
VADDKASTLRSSSQQREALEVEFDTDVKANLLLNISGVLQAKRGEGNTWILAHDSAMDIRPAVFRFAVDNGLQVLGLQKSERGLEEVFKELTRK